MKAQRIVASLMFVILLGIVLAGSYVSVNLWSGPVEEISKIEIPSIEEDMPPVEIARLNKIDEKIVLNALGISESRSGETIRMLGFTTDQAEKRIRRQLVLFSENASKNWKKIVAKFVLWVVYILVFFTLIRKFRLKRRHRLFLYFVPVVIFGIILGADPSPLGTVKDAIVLLGMNGVVFPPRLAAFAIFSLLVVVFNKSICAWGCQFGTMQDLVFRFFRNKKDSAGIVRQFKPPFRISNGVRVLAVIAITVFAFAYATDIMEFYDPFRIFKPQKAGIALVFIFMFLLVSIFVYRPFCHFLCPFGLTGWLFEKISIFKINVDRETCISCKACSRACPSTVMEAILEGNKRTIPDCFSCGVCRTVCPTNSVDFRSGKRKGPKKPA